jgi:hypothetical protein
VLFAGNSHELLQQSHSNPAAVVRGQADDGKFRNGIVDGAVARIGFAELDLAYWVASYSFKNVCGTQQNRPTGRFFKSHRFCNALSGPFQKSMIRF